MRRRHRPARLRIADLVLDPATREVRRGDRQIWLSPREFSLLHHLVRHRNQTVHLSEIAREVWGHRETMSQSAYKQVIRSLRQKIETPGQPTLLHTSLSRAAEERPRAAIQPATA